MFTTQYPVTHAFIKVLAIEILREEGLICSFRLCAECLLIELLELHESIRTDNEYPLTRTGMAACARLWGNAAETRLEGGDEGNGCKAAIVPESSLNIAALVLVLRCFDMQAFV